MKITRITVMRALGAHWAGRLAVGSLVIRCALGRSGVSRRKVEGDGATPAGQFALLNGRLRVDRMGRLQCAIPMTPIRRSSGWCDDPHASNYNRAAQLPIESSHEKLWREDSVYDLFFVLDYNIAPRKAFAGSAVFFHIAHADYRATEGCVAIGGADMRRLAPRLSKRCVMLIR